MNYGHMFSSPKAWTHLPRRPGQFLQSVIITELSFVFWYHRNILPDFVSILKPNIWRLFYRAPILEGSVLGDERNGLKSEPERCLSPGTDVSLQSCRVPGLFYDLSVHISLTKLTQDAGVTETYVISKAGLKSTWHDLCKFILNCRSRAVAVIPEWEQENSTLCTYSISLLVYAQAIHLYKHTLQVNWSKCCTFSSGTCPGSLLNDSFHHFLILHQCLVPFCLSSHLYVGLDTTSPVS